MENHEAPFDIPGGWHVRQFKLTGHVFDVLLPADPDCVLEARLEADSCESSADSDPYWAALWSSAIPTAEAVLQADWQGHESVLEIGCGVGLVGLAALARGLQVTFSDYMQQAIDLALDNARRNGFAGARALQLDWHALPCLSPDQQYNVILASDILYQRANHGPILDAIDQLLVPGGCCWIGDPGRYNSREFLNAACERFRVQLRDRDGTLFSTPQAGHYQMFVLRR